MTINRLWGRKAVSKKKKKYTVISILFVLDYFVSKEGGTFF